MKKGAVPRGTAPFSMCPQPLREDRAAQGSAFAVHHRFGLGSGFFSGAGNIVSSLASSFGGRVGSAFHGFTGFHRAFFHGFASGFGVGFGISGHCIDAFARFVGLFSACGKAKSRGRDSSCKNDLTHNRFPFHSGLRANGSPEPARKPSF